jgi:hypothetical protein
MSEPQTPTHILEALLKAPGRLIHELERNWKPTLVVWLVIFAVAGMAAYGVVVGTFAGGAQMWVAPAKLVLGTIAVALICLPSLYIFSCLGGIDARLRMVTGVLFAAVALSALLLVAFAPVAWIFSQSTDSVALIGALHLILWIVAISFGIRMIGAMSRWLAGSSRGHMKIWSCIFIVVCMQMTTTLRPIVGKSDHFLPREKKFFLAHWLETLGGKAEN